VGTVIQETQRGKHERTQRWERGERAELCAQYGDLQAQGLSQRQAAKALEVPRSTLQAWRASQARLDECPTVVAFFASVPGLACRHRLVLGMPLVCTEVGACGIRRVCLVGQLTGLDRFVAASYGAQHQVNCQKDMPAKDLTVAQDEPCTGGLCLVAMAPKSNDMLLEQATPARDHGPWHALREQALSGLNGHIRQSTSDEAPA
jgi:hypothetical protein